MEETTHELQGGPHLRGQRGVRRAGILALPEGSRAAAAELAEQGAAETELLEETASQARREVVSAHDRFDEGHEVGDTGGLSLHPGDAVRWRDSRC